MSVPGDHCRLLQCGHLGAAVLERRCLERRCFAARECGRPRRRRRRRACRHRHRPRRHRRTSRQQCRRMASSMSVSVRTPVESVAGNYCRGSRQSVRRTARSRKVACSELESSLAELLDEKPRLQEERQASQATAVPWSAWREKRPAAGYIDRPELQYWSCAPFYSHCQLQPGQLPLCKGKRRPWSLTLD